MRVLGEGVGGFRHRAPRCRIRRSKRPPTGCARASSAMHALGGIAAGRASADWRSSVAAIGLTGQLPTLVCLGEARTGGAGNHLEGRARRCVGRRASTARAARITRAPACRSTAATSLPCGSFISRDRIGRGAHVLSAKDYLLYALTGLRMTEPSTAAGYGVYDLQERAFAEDLCEFWHLPAATVAAAAAREFLRRPVERSRRGAPRLARGHPGEHAARRTRSARPMRWPASTSAWSRSASARAR